MDTSIVKSQELRKLSVRIKYTDIIPRELFMLPLGAEIVDILVDVETQFDDTGTNQLNFGVTGDPDALVQALDISGAPGRVALGAALVQPTYATMMFNGIAITAQYVGGNGDASAGEAKVTFIFALRQGTRI